MILSEEIELANKVSAVWTSARVIDLAAGATIMVQDQYTSFSGDVDPFRAELIRASRYGRSGSLGSKAARVYAPHDHAREVGGVGEDQHRGVAHAAAVLQGQLHQAAIADGALVIGERHGTGLLLEKP
jgi:hypothetical protein